MAEIWDMRTSDDRSLDSMQSFTIFCEDELYEPFYFRSFAVANKVKINAYENQKSGKLNLQSTIVECLRLDHLIFNNGYRVRSNIAENLWCVYDRDSEHRDIINNKPSDNAAFNLAIQAALTAGINVAWSNDVFELWILLHFQVVDPRVMLHRDEIYHMLTIAFQTIDPPPPELQQILALPNFSYRGNLKKKVPFILAVLPELKKRTGVAIANARVLEAHFNESVEFHQQNPCTKIHLLITKILNAY